MPSDFTNFHPFSFPSVFLFVSVEDFLAFGERNAHSRALWSVDNLSQFPSLSFLPCFERALSSSCEKSIHRI